MPARPEAYRFIMQTNDINFTLDGKSDDCFPANVSITVKGQTASIPLKALNVIIASLNYAKNKHTDSTLNE